MKTAVIITIGDELLQGYTIDTNSAWLSQTLINYGVEVEQIRSIPDTINHIDMTISELMGKYDFLFTTGGLGPTVDDVTFNALRKRFDLEVLHDEDYENILRQRFKNRGIDMPEINKNQANYLSESTIIPNELGSARGIHINKNGHHIISMPGVPIEMKGMVMNYIIPKIFSSKESNKIKLIRTTGITESKLAENIQNEIEKYQDRYLFSFLPKFTGVDFKIKQIAKCEVGINDTSRHFYELLSPYAFGWEEDVLEDVVVKLMKEKSLTCATAESCSGGLIAKRLTNCSGSSEVFNGGIVAYSDNVKENIVGVNPNTLNKFGAVSKEVVEELSMNITQCFKTDIGIASTGISGPTGGTDEKPVGLVFISIYFKNKFYTKKFNFFKNRKIHREMTAQAALNMLRKTINE